MRNVILEESIEYIDKIVNNNDKIIYNSAELKKHWDRVKRFTTTAAAYAEFKEREEDGEYDNSIE